LAGSVAALFLSQVETASSTVHFQRHDPGVRGGCRGAGKAFANLTTNQLTFFDSGAADFAAAEEVEKAWAADEPRQLRRLSHPAALGGISPVRESPGRIRHEERGTDKVPPFIASDGPVREARFVKNPDGTADGGVHAIFHHHRPPGRSLARALHARAADFATQLANRNVIFRIPTPTFGAGLIEQIPDASILANQRGERVAQAALGIRGRPNFHVAGRTITGMTNNNGNDGTIARFGWKAQNKSLLLFSGEAYNVEMGITNELFQTERERSAAMPVRAGPERRHQLRRRHACRGARRGSRRFANFMRFL
jgi:hypothetical protein